MHRKSRISCKRKENAPNGGCPGCLKKGDQIPGTNATADADEIEIVSSRTGYKGSWMYAVLGDTGPLDESENPYIWTSEETQAAVSVEMEIAMTLATGPLAELGMVRLGKKLAPVMAWWRASKGGGTFYRAMSNAEYAALEINGGLTHLPGKELFVSSSANYSRAYLQKSGYDVLVQFNMKSGAMNYFNQVGVMHRTVAAASGWADRGSLLWKLEQGVMNLGIQSNTHMFNPWINSFKVIK